MTTDGDGVRWAASLVNLHGQHESQALLNDDAQRDVLDALAGATDVASSRS